jgi:hypothetical protein
MAGIRLICVERSGEKRMRPERQGLALTRLNLAKLAVSAQVNKDAKELNAPIDPLMPVLVGAKKLRLCKMVPAAILD